VPDPDIPLPTCNIPVLNKAERNASLLAILAQRPIGPFWVFAYGSLIWNPAFEPAETRHATLFGYHRSFCFWTMVARGTPERPGLGLALEKKSGTRCQGVAMKVDKAREASDLKALWTREMYSGVYQPTWVTLETLDDKPSTFPAMTFVADPSHPQFCPSLSDEQRAYVIAGACGRHGTCADYLQNVVDHLRQIDEPDSELENLLVAVRQLPQRVGSA